MAPVVDSLEFEPAAACPPYSDVLGADNTGAMTLVSSLFMPHGEQLAAQAVVVTQTDS